MAGVLGWLVVTDPTRIYLPNELQGYDRIQFNYIEDNFSESKSANYSATAILGRSEPVRGYMGSSPRALNLMLRIPIEGDNPPGFIPTTQDAVVTSGIVGDSATKTTEVQTYPLGQIDDTFDRKLQVIDFIRSLVYPHYGTQTQQLVYPPPRVLVLLGNWFAMLGIVTSYSMNHRAPWADSSMVPYFTDVTISVEECDEPYSFSDVYTGALRQGGFNHSKISPSGISSRIG